MPQLDPSNVAVTWLEAGQSSVTVFVPLSATVTGLVYVSGRRSIDALVNPQRVFLEVVKRPGESDSAATNKSFRIIGASAPWFEETVKKVSRLASLQANWDSYRSMPMKPEIIDFAIRILGWLEEEDLPIPSVVPCPSGSVQFEWNEQGRELEIEILPDSQFGFLKVFPDGTTEEKESEVATPDKLRRLTRWLMKG
jgi:hypothetical protein